MTGTRAADASPTIGDLRGTIRLLQRRLNLIEHLADEAPEGWIPVHLVRAALRSTIEQP